MTDNHQPVTKAFTGKLEPEDVHYVPLSVVKGKACANCRWFIAGAYPSMACYLVDASDMDDEPIIATGLCDRWEGTPVIVQPEVEPIPVVIVDSPAPIEMSSEKERTELIIDPSASIMTQLQNRIRRQPLKDGTHVLKDNAGQRYMFMVTSNGYRDGDNAHVTTKAIEDYVEKCWTDDGKFIGDNSHYIWHTKELGSISDLVFADVWSGFLVEVWREKADPIAKGFYNYVERHPEMDWAASQGFWGSRTEKAAGLYKSIAKYESTSLPRAAASNVYTLSEVLPMIEKSKRDVFLNNFFKEEFGIEDAAATLKEGPEKLRAKLADRGIEAKALGGDAVQKVRTEAMQGTADLILSMVEVQDQVEKQVSDLATSHATELKLRDDKITAVEKNANIKITQLEKELGEVRAIVNAPPRRPSQDSSTVVPATDQVLKDNLPAADPVGAWLGLPMKPKTT